MKKIIKILSIIICLLLIFPISLLTACGPEVSTELVYEGKTLNPGKVGVEYTSVSLATATGYDDIKYECTSYLPKGLELSETGILSGTPKESWNVGDMGDEGGTLKIEATSNGIAKTATFILIISKGTFSYEGGALEATSGETCSLSVATVTGAVNAVSYSMKAGSNLPEGLFMSNLGAITGTPMEEVQNHSFTVIAKADEYETKEAVFTITVNEGEISIADSIVYNTATKTLEIAEVGTSYTSDLTADQIVYLNNKLATRYAFTAVNGVGLPIGLTLAATGVLTGTALDSTHGTLHFRVRAYVVTITTTVAPANKPTLSGFVETENTEFAAAMLDAYLLVQDKEVVTKKYEAEWIDLTGIQGSGYSSDNGGTAMICNRPECSGGFSLGYMHKTDVSVAFVFNSAQAATGTLKIRLAAETAETYPYSDEQYFVTINGQKVPFGSITITGSGVGETIAAFNIFNLGNIALRAGENIIRITVRENNYRIGGTAGPEIDYIEIETAANLSWRPKVYNTANR